MGSCQTTINKSTFLYITATLALVFNSYLKCISSVYLKVHLAGDFYVINSILCSGFLQSWER